MSNLRIVEFIGVFMTLGIVIGTMGNVNNLIIKIETLIDKNNK